MTAPQPDARWWLCCYQCAPNSAFPDAPGLLVVGSTEDEPDAAAEAMLWVGEHGDETGHRDIVMFRAHPLAAGESMPRPRHGSVVVGDIKPGTPLMATGRPMRLTPVSEQGKPIGPTVHLLAGRNMTIRPLNAEGWPTGPPIHAAHGITYLTYVPDAELPPKSLPTNDAGEER